jgi:hypothetical protein
MINNSNVVVNRTSVLVFAILLLAGAPAAAQTEAERIRARVKEGQEVTVTDEQGREFSGRIATVSGDGLRIVSKNAAADLLYGEIVRIGRPRDTLSNGALIGLASGAAFGFAVMLSEDNRSCNPDAFFDCSDPSASGYVVVTALTGGLGAAIGVGVDALIRSDGNLYQRGSTRMGVSPALFKGGPGARLSISW